MPGLYLPPSHAIHDKPVRYQCALCGKPFFEGERNAFERHCLGHGHEEIRSHSLRVQAPGLFDPYYEGGDVAWQKWIDAHKDSDPHGWRRWMKTGLDK